MGNELIRPIDPDTARAVEETAKFANAFLETGSKLGGYVDRIVGKLPDNVVGLLLGDRVAHLRVRQWARLQAETKEQLRKWGVKEPYEDPSLSVALPLIQAAVDETRDELKALWAKLLAAAMHPERKRWVRVSLIDIVKQLDPLDARVLKKAQDHTTWLPSPASALASLLEVSSDEIEVSLANLVRVELVGLGPTGNPFVKPMGRLLLQAVRD